VQVRTKGTVVSVPSPRTPSHPDGTPVPARHSDSAAQDHPAGSLLVVFCKKFIDKTIRLNISSLYGIS
jgi:hypothetical protein